MTTRVTPDHREPDQSRPNIRKSRLGFPSTLVEIDLLCSVGTRIQILARTLGHRKYRFSQSINDSVADSLDPRSLLGLLNTHPMSDQLYEVRRAVEALFIEALRQGHGVLT